jgi:hypothetical protein
MGLSSHARGLSHTTTLKQTVWAFFRLECMFLCILRVPGAERPPISRIPLEPVHQPLYLRSGISKTIMAVATWEMARRTLCKRSV